MACDLDQTSGGAVRDILRDLLTAVTGWWWKMRCWSRTSWSAMHAGMAPRRGRLALLGRGNYMRIEVDDSSPKHPRIRTPDTFGGRGLILVDRLSSRWGVRQHTSHKTVWAELVLDGADSSGGIPHIAPVPTVST